MRIDLLRESAKNQAIKRAFVAFFQLKKLGKDVRIKYCCVSHKRAQISGAVTGYARYAMAYPDF